MLNIQHIQHYPLGGENALKLELKHIALYLPYDLKCHAMGEKEDNDDSESAPKILTVTGTYTDSHMDRYIEAVYNGDQYEIFFNTDFFPLLRPLSDLYKERNGKIDIVELAKIHDRDFDVEEDYRIGTTTQYPTEGYVDYWTNDGLECRFGWYDSFQAGCINPNKHMYVKNQLQLFQYLFENHYDIFGLIEKGLAIDINTIKP